MIYWTLFFLKYLALYVALVNFANDLFTAISFWLKVNIGKHVFGWRNEVMAFVVYLMLSNFV